jgi:hypothetical protein
MWGLNVNIPNTEYINVGSDIQDIKLELNIDIKGSRTFRYLGSIFTNSGKCNEVLHGTEQARKATSALNVLHWSKYISMNTKKRIFYTETESILNYGWEIWTLDDKLKRALLSTEIDFWRRVARTSKLLKVRNGIRKRRRVTQTSLERLNNIMLKYYGQVVCTENKRWSKRIKTWSPEGRRRRGRPEVKWEKEVERVMKQRNLTSKDAIKGKV